MLIAGLFRFNTVFGYLVKNPGKYYLHICRGKEFRNSRELFNSLKYNNNII